MLGCNSCGLQIPCLLVHPSSVVGVSFSKADDQQASVGVGRTACVSKGHCLLKSRHVSLPASLDHWEPFRSRPFACPVPRQWLRFLLKPVPIICRGTESFRCFFAPPNLGSHGGHWEWPEAEGWGLPGRAEGKLLSMCVLGAPKAQTLLDCLVSLSCRN